MPTSWKTPSILQYVDSQTWCVVQKTILKGTLQVPGDKSISHRALIFPVFARGRCKVRRLSPAADCQSTIGCLKALGIKIEQSGADDLTIDAPGRKGLQQPQALLDAGNSGTTIRLLSGILAGQAFKSTLDGDHSLRKRPMARVLGLLQEMGATIRYLQNENRAPFEIEGGALHGKTFKLQVASAQVQTALILAGLQAEGHTVVELPALVRDHTERMLKHAGIPFSQNGLSMQVSQLTEDARPFDITVAGDISSAAFFMVASACLPGSELILTDVGLNPGRTLVLEVLQEMGADITVTNKHLDGGEPVGTITVRGGGRLKGVTIGGDRIAAGIDEIPILALAGSLCQGVFSVRDAGELRVKESDRLKLIAENLRSAGATIHELEDGFDIEGADSLRGGSEWQTEGDHRLAMMGLVANVLLSSPVRIDDTDCISVSYPKFADDFAQVATTAR